jgi:hypothetical protein
VVAESDEIRVKIGGQAWMRRQLAEAVEIESNPVSGRPMAPK